MKSKSQIIQEAHRHSAINKKEILSSQKCGCFYCLEIFTPAIIDEWVDNNDTALCPHCGIDSVIGDKSAYPITKDFLLSMQKFWF